MSEIETPSAGRDQDACALRDEDLEHVSGGFGFVERNFSALLPAVKLLPPNPCRFLIG